jgi:hypothetical protein
MYTTLPVRAVYPVHSALSGEAGGHTPRGHRWRRREYESTLGDPNFTFNLTSGEHIGPPDYGANPLGIIESYDISWTEVAGQLEAVDITLFSFNDTVDGIGFSGGRIASDSGFGGCNNTQCSITGYWSAVPEPGSATLLLSVLVSLGLVRCASIYRA